MLDIDTTFIINLIGIAADLMTILGISGLFAWSFAKKELDEKNVADIGIGIFAISIKLVLCFIIVSIYLIPAFGTHFFIVLAFSGDYVASDGFWNAEKIYVYILAYSITILFWLPISILTIASIFTWSSSPFKRFFNSVRNKD